ncbi:MAG: hypothetical protein J6K82_01875 [Alphaproteobacteria bacterium]|nr:hypothetical protein [Alphaproteobacteria bacterium]
MKIPVLYQIDRAFCKYRHRRRLRNKLSRYKYIHVLPYGGIHSGTITNFINKYFDNSEHAFLFRGRSETSQGLREKYNNVFIGKPKCIPLSSCKKIIWHSLLDQRFVKFLYKNKRYLKKSYWFIWGGDLYFAPDNERNNYVKSNVAGILTAFDSKEYENKYGLKKCYDVTYPHATSNLPKSRDGMDKKSINILVNNCADETTIEMLHILSRFKEYDINIYTVLSYVAANQTDKRLDIMYSGYELFGNKFHPMLKYLDTSEYSEFLSSIDIYISNQNRPQGNGNASQILSNGGKIFVKSGTGIYERYNSIGIRYFDTNEIQNMTFEQFVEYDNETKERSVRLLRQRMADETKVQQWKAFFED